MTPKETLCAVTLQGVPVLLWILMMLQIVPLYLALLHDVNALTHTPPTSFRSVLQAEVEKKSKYCFSIISVN